MPLLHNWNESEENFFFFFYSSMFARFLGGSNEKQRDEAYSHLFYERIDFKYSQALILGPRDQFKFAVFCKRKLDDFVEALRTRNRKRTMLSAQFARRCVPSF